MIEHEIELATNDGTMSAFVTHPEEGGPHPAVFFYMDAVGKREELHDMARRLGTAGYYVVLPNLYYRQTREFVADLDDPDSVKRLFELMRTVTSDMVVDDTRALWAHIDATPAARGGPVGCVGYCMSGPFVMSVAAAYPERIAAAASFYGVRLLTDKPTSPHLRAAAIRGELYLGFAETDAFVPAGLTDQLDAHLRRAGIRYRIEHYPGTQHGFAFPQRRNVYDKLGGERHWERLLALFRRNLQDVAFAP